MSKVLMKGNEALGEAAIRAGCRHYFGYPITPQSELIEYMAKMLPKCDGCFLQAESEVAAINMIYGAAASGVRCFTSSSSPGISLKMEGVSYCAGAELPMVFVNVVRGGPGLGDIQPAQSDYFQATKGGGHGDYRLIVLAPASVQESVDMMSKAFDLADKYRNPVMILTDGLIGQMMEPAEFPAMKTAAEIKALREQHKSWCLHPRAKDNKQKRNIVKAFEIDPVNLEKNVLAMYEKYAQVEKAETDWEEYGVADDNQMLFVGYGTSGRIAKTVVDMYAEQGVSVGLVRPKTLWPFPHAAIKKAAAKVKKVVVVELSMGQMVEDVRLAVNGAVDVELYTRTGGMVFTPEDIKKFADKKFAEVK